ncbi:MAG: hypothetical protein RLZZ502_80, partial [Pseudomonadota bacterium]
MALMRDCFLLPLIAVGTLTAQLLQASTEHEHEISKNSGYGILSSQTSPRVVIVGQTTMVRFEFIMNPGSYSGTPVLVLANGTRMSTNDAGNNGDVTAGDGIFSVNVPLSSMGTIKPSDTAYRADVGSLEVTEGSGVSKYNVFMNVMDESIPNVPVKTLNSTTQQSAHLLNLVSPNQLAYVRQFKSTSGGTATQELTTLVASALPLEQYDMLFASYDRNHFDNSFYQVINNNIGGIGKSPTNLSGFNAGTRLMGLMMIGSPLRFDGADIQFTHEFGHHWMSGLTLNSALSDGRPHWPYSSMGSGVMGVSIAGSGAGGTFFCEGSFNAAGTAVTLNGTTLSTSKFNLYNPLDLYLMGLMPASQVPDQIIYDSADMKACKPGTYTSGYTRLKVQDVINFHGPRTPAYGQAPSNFKVASVIVSSQLLTAREMAYFDLMARRASWRFNTISKTGFVTEKAAPFYQATGGRGTLDTVMDASLVSHEVLTVTEFYNTALKRYFYTADPAETAYLKATPATGEAATG